ncbi:bifunctional D-glycero-beta-D-manno-heptose-7-phosphate kinase/D-glycero-beta-D-manno-heptose 1-phosphate adenylyltransferase HldE [Dichelobacter nodosus]|uniref:bifunctional D-glycero-beta-D-manno-heptose-7-phosphate kinase/D-glycero-beta-D-manno-heptose 1-phosphate adenylyltransferase HldE n=1 Tax=Dichelobacter nodosus TaxID=870 RepID=UPI000681F709|nr:bifunctional D-glycero-beta-D-manno-heptose-7-phosphate kinase/D-glycero-beta-D-manno-heptose 1-phosphate adenylyltransferase HldE [Dichelobacter nodosus]KNZ39714.1 heptose 1-phosphate adenyltransferase [Dichelobacter nodosus]
MTQFSNLPIFERARILVVGDTMLDRNWSGLAQRISPEAPVPVVNIEQQTATAGGAANVAMNIAALGGQVYLCGLIGDDDAGAVLRQIMREHAIGDALSVCALPTITKLRVLSQHQQLIRLDFESNRYAECAHLMAAPFNRALPEHDLVIFSDYGKGSLHNVSTLIAQAKAAGKWVLVDPKGTDFQRYRGADIVTPNVAELTAVVGHFADEKTMIAKARACLIDAGISAFLITQSEKGMTYVTAQQHYHLPAQAREVFDVTGAGDTVIATLACALASGYDCESAMIFANAAASVVVGKLGTATLTPTELHHALAPRAAKARGLVDLSQLQEQLHYLKKQGKTVVMTNGCFDILHAGHVRYLEEAKALGDCLIVAINTDESVKRLKGADRPANTLASRAAVLAALHSVDWVISFAEDTPADLIAAINPDILVKGGDNRVDDIPGAQWVREHGGSVRVLSYVDGFSTTKTLQQFLSHHEKD